MRQEIDLGDRKVTIIGTSHVSEESRQEVESAIEDLEPDLVAVELDQERLESLRDRKGWRDLDMAEAIRKGKGSLLLFNLILSIYQRRIGLQKDIEPGSEMLSAIEKAEDLGIGHALIDREVSETFARLRAELSLREKMMLLTEIMLGEEADTEDLVQENLIDSLVEELGDRYPALRKVLLDERNFHMAEKLREEDFDHALVVVGAAHVKGLAKELGQQKIKRELQDCGGLRWLKIAKYAVPSLILAGLGYSFYKIGFSTGVKATRFWILSNGLLAMVGAIAARSHPLTWLVSFLAAPLTSLDPAIGAGMVASYSEAKFYPPKVGELEDIAYIESYRELWSNQVGRILLTFFLVSLGSAAATFISAGYIASLIGF